MSNRDITTLTGVGAPTSILTRQDGDARYAPFSGGTAAWGNITGLLSSQTDLQNALNATVSNAALATSLALKANLAGAAFTGALSATNLSGTNTGDETSSSVLSKLSAASGGGTTNFLRADGTWVAPATGTGSANIAVVDLFSDIATQHPAATIKFIMTRGRTVIGTHGALYMRDPDQTTYTTIGAGLISAAASAANAQAAINNILNRVRLQDADGTYWIIDDDRQVVHAGHFGAVADARQDYTTGNITGTDSQPAMQALIDWRMYLMRFLPNANKDIIIPCGNFRINKGLQLGYGDTYIKMVIRSEKSGVASDPNGGGYGTIIQCDFDDHPAISINTGLNTEIRDLSLSGKARAWMLSNRLWGFDYNRATTSVDDRDITQCHNPAFPTHAALLRYNPYAAVAVDPYAGNQPPAPVAWTTSNNVNSNEYRIANSNLYRAYSVYGTTASTGTGPTATKGFIKDGSVVWQYVGPSTVATSYPASTTARPPAFLPDSLRTGWNRVLSTKPILTRVQITGFAVGVAVQPSDIDGNGDFLTMEDCAMKFVTVAISIGQTQSRNVHLTCCDFVWSHTVYATTFHGRCNGHMGGILQENTYSSCYQVLEMRNAASIYGPLTLLSCYGEEMYRLATLGGGGASGGSILFDQCQFGFDAQDTANGGRGVPLNAIIGGNGNDNITFRGTTFSGYVNVFPINTNAKLLFEDLHLQDRNFGNPAADKAHARFINTTAGGLIVPANNPVQGSSIFYSSLDETGFNSNSGYTKSPDNRQNRNAPVSMYTDFLQPSGGYAIAEYIVNPKPFNYIDRGSMGSATLTGRTLSYTYNYGSADEAVRQGCVKGAVLFDAVTGMVFLVTNVTGTSVSTVTAELQNGYRYSGASEGTAGLVVLEVPFDLSSGGNMFLVGGGLFTPSNAFTGDLSTSSTAITNVQRFDGYGGAVADWPGCPIQVGDMVYGGQFEDNVVYIGRVTSLGTDTFSVNNAPMKDISGYRFKLFIRG